MGSQSRRPSPFARGVTFLLVATFAFLQVAEAAEIHRCAHHDGPLAATEALPHDPGTAHSHDADAVYPREGSHEADAEHGCTCMGDCQASPGVALAGIGTLAVLASAPQRLERAPYAAPLSAGADHVLPFAHAPPTSA